nr:putative GPI-anchored protein PB15E9.01c; partial [Biomphalaria glabrata]
MFLSHVVLLGASMFVAWPGGVDGATCTTAQTCQTTDFTLSTCPSGTCVCRNSSFVPVRTGCALKLDKPVIITASQKSGQVVAGSSFTLYCNVADASDYEWYLGTTKLPSSSRDFTAVATSVTVGAFTCKGIGQDTSITSDLSDPFTMEMLGPGGLTSSDVKPVIQIPTTAVVAGSTIRIGCLNTPFGYTDILYQINGIETTSPAVTIDNTNAGKDVVCYMRIPPTGVAFTRPSSDYAKLPTLITNIQSVSVTFNNQYVTQVTDYFFTSITLTCTTSPMDVYLGTSLSITYTWKNFDDVLGYTSQTLPVSSDGKYSCSASLGSETAVMSNNTVTVVWTSKIRLTKSSSSPIQGGRVVLTCDDKSNEGASYTWWKETDVIYRQFDRKLQLDDISTADSGTYSCMARTNSINFYGRTTVTVQGEIVRPYILHNSNGYFREKGDYKLQCITLSETVGMTYEWIYNGLVSEVRTKYYNLPSITSMIEGEYACRAIFRTVTSNTSSTLAITVKNPGRFCYQDTECNVDPAYTGLCDLNDRCQCSDGYWQKGDVCTNAVVQTLSSVVIITLTSVIGTFL